MSIKIVSGYYNGLDLHNWESLVEFVERTSDMRFGMSMWVSFKLSHYETLFYIRCRKYRIGGLENEALVFNNIYIPKEIQGQGYFRKLLQDEIFPLCVKRGLMFVIEAASKEVIQPKTTQKGSVWCGFKENDLNTPYPSYYKLFKEA